MTNRGYWQLLAGAFIGTVLVASRKRRRPAWPSAASYHPVQRGAGGRGRAVRRITIQRQPGEVYRAFRDLGSLPRYFTYLTSVREQGNGRWRWAARLPNGTTAEWDVEITDDRDGQYLAWRSTPGSPIETRVSIRLDPGPPGRGTEVTVTLESRAAAGPFGRPLARVVSLGLNEALRRFKQWVEAGEIATTAGQSSGRERERRRDELHATAERLRQRRAGDRVHEASLESFPASDSPASRGGM